MTDAELARAIVPPSVCVLAVLGLAPEVHVTDEKLAAFEDEYRRVNWPMRWNP